MNDMTKLAYGGYGDPVKNWNEHQDVLNQWAELVPAVLPRSSPMETWGLSAALTATLREQTYGKDESKAKEGGLSQSTPSKNNQKESTKLAKKTRCSRIALQQLSQPKHVSSNTQSESYEDRHVLQSTSGCRRTQLNGVSPDTFELWKTGKDRLVASK